MFRTKLCAACAAAAVFFNLNDVYGQKIDPVVEVTRDYEGRLMVVHKPLQTMPVADSLQHFDLEFEYSVNDSPYKGTFEFNPLLLNIVPGPSENGGRVFRLRAGAGYALQPQLDFVWSPRFDGSRFRMSLYGTHGSYIGRYRGIGSWADGGRTVLDAGSKGNRQSLYEGHGYSGYDMETKAGISGAAGWEGGEFTFDVGYLGIAMKDTSLVRHYDALDVRLRARSDGGPDRLFFYDAAVGYRYGNDNMSFPAARRSFLTEHLFSLDASLGPVFSESSRALLDIGFNFAGYAGLSGEYAGDFSVTPRYVFRKGRWSLDLGVKFAVTMHNTPSGGMYDISKGQFVYPDVRIGFAAVREYLDIYLLATGGDRVSSWSGFLASDRFYNPAASSSYPLGNTVERVSVFLGLDGNIASRLGYDFRAGYVNYASAFLDGVSFAGNQPQYAPGFAACQMFRADLKLVWKSDAVSAGADLSCRITDILSHSSGLFGPAAFAGRLHATYNWRGRIYAGADCRLSTSRNSVVRMEPADIDVRIPGYADLGVNAGYRFSRSFSVWARAGNLLNMTVQDVPLHAGPGINFTAGICLEL